MAADPEIITALDFPAESDALELAERLDPQSTNLKVGNELFTAAGPKLVRNLQGLGFRIFLDLKFHDIPNTVASALRAAVDLGVWMTNIHASGGRRMLDAARAAVPAGGNTKLIAVTVLTSTSDDELSDCGVHGTIDEQVLRLAALTRDSGLDGVVCSPQESTLLRRAIGDDFLLVTPGVRPQGSGASDQRRVMTPRAAIDAGSDYLVIGRPITQAKDPPSVLASIMDTLKTKRVRS